MGAKLLPAALDRILFHNELRIRPYIASRMPGFSPEKLKDFPGLLASADAAAIAGNPPAVVTPHAEKEGWKLVGVKGLGCINCHGARGAKSIGVPGADLTVMRERVRPEWFRRWMADPGKLVPGTRMPSFWNEGKSSLVEIAGGAFDPQVNAIWTYLQQGPEMVLPLGLRLDNSDEIVPFDEIIVLRAFVTGVGSRSILVGNPESIHWVFDANTMRLAKAWRGKFFDAAGANTVRTVSGASSSAQGNPSASEPPPMYAGVRDSSRSRRIARMPVPFGPHNHLWALPVK